MHDGAVSHSVCKRTCALQQAGIEIILLLPQSPPPPPLPPDENPIECVWNIMKSYIRDLYPKVAYERQISELRLRKAISDTWRSISLKVTY